MLAVRRRLDFDRDTLAFANELVWEYHFDEATGATTTRRRVPPPDYALRCFVLVRAVRCWWRRDTGTTMCQWLRCT